MLCPVSSPVLVGNHEEMNIYDRWVLPHLIDIAMRHAEATRYRTAIVPKAHGDVLEIGMGSGLNLPFYSSEVKRLYALDPSKELLTMARMKVSAVAFPVEFLACSSEAIPLADGSIDTVVMTWTLCSVRDPAKALSEMRRVLKPGGSLLFAEHGFSCEARIQGWQQKLTPVWKKIAGGCHLDRRIDKLIVASGFDITELQTGYANGLRPLSYIYSGEAQPASHLKRSA